MEQPLGAFDIADLTDEEIDELAEVIAEAMMDQLTARRSA
jgi:hypothetical protein